MKLLILSLLFSLSACSTYQQRRIASGLPEKPKKIDYLALLGTGFFDGPIAITPPGIERPAKVFLPKNYKEREQWPLILMLHGYTSYADESNVYLGLGSRVTAKGYILLTPDGKTNSMGDQFWNATDFCCDFEKTGVDDVNYLLKLVEETARLYHVDRNRIYLFGHSNGGFMGNRLLCETDGVFAGMVSLAGSTFKDLNKCRLKNPVSYLQIHAEKDPMVDFGENPNHAGGKETTMRRVAAAGCTGEPEAGARKDLVKLIPSFDTTPVTWNHCLADTEVSLWTIDESKVDGHKPHTPGFNQPDFVDSAVDFLFKHKKPAQK